MNQDKITPDQVTQWTNHPVTQLLSNLIELYIKEEKQEIIDRTVHGISLGAQDLHQISQLRGQILAFEKIVNVREFLLEALEEITDTLDEKIHD